MSTPLSARDRSRLKARAHALEPIIQIGHGGLTDTVVAEINRALTAHELIKVRAGGHDREARAELSRPSALEPTRRWFRRSARWSVYWRARPDEAEDHD